MRQAGRSAPQARVSLGSAGLTGLEEPFESGGNLNVDLLFLLDLLISFWPSTRFSVRANAARLSKMHI